MSKTGLFDHLGNPLRQMAKAAQATSALDELSRYGVEVADDGAVNIPPEAMKRIREDRLRRATISKVPSTPRTLFRDAGGMGVRKGHSRFEVLSLDSLRKIRERSPILQAIHSARHFQVRRMARPWSGKRGDVGWRVVHKDHFDHQAEQPEYIRPYVKRFTETLTSPAERYECRTTGDMLAPLWEDLATINRPVVELLRSAWSPNTIVGFRPVDGAIIWPTLVWLEKWLAENPRWFQQGGRSHDPKKLSEQDALYLISEIVGQDIGGADYCLVRESVLEAVYKGDDLIVAPMHNRTDISYSGYPPGHVEDAIETVLSFLNAFEFNGSYFTRGMLAEFILGVSGDVHDDDVDAFVDMLREATQGVGKAWQPPVMPLPTDGTITKIDLKPSNKEMMFETWMSLLVALTCANYRMDPSTINAKPWEGGGGGALSSPNREKEIALAKEEGLQGDLGHLVESILVPLAKTCHPDLRVVMEYGDYDPQKEAAVYEVQARTSRTRNEIRLESGDEPKGFWCEPEEYDSLPEEDQKKYDNNPWNWPTDSGFASAMNQAQMRDQMAQQQQPQDDGFGEAPAGEDQAQGDDDGFGGGPAGEDQGFGKPPPQKFPFGQPPGAPAQQQAPQAAPQQPPSAAPAPRPPVPTQPLQKARRVTVRVEEIP